MNKYNESNITDMQKQIGDASVFMGNVVELHRDNGLKTEN